MPGNLSSAVDGGVPVSRPPRGRRAVRLLAGTALALALLVFGVSLLTRSL